MKSVAVVLIEDKRCEVPEGTTVSQALAKAGVDQEGQALAARVNGTLVDLGYRLMGEAVVEIITFQSKEGREIYRHSTSHLMAQAVQQLYPVAQKAIGPAIADGFYYDFAHPQTFSPADLERIEDRMRKLIATDLPITRHEVPRGEARQLFDQRGERYKVELIDGIAAEMVVLYSQGEFIDLCRGPHLPSTGRIGAIKLLNTSGAYWRGDERGTMLQRIYGTSFPSPLELEAHLHRLEEARRRDHRRLGRELDLFSIQEEAGPGFVIYHPKGAMLRAILEEFEREEHLQRGYQLVIGPHLLKRELWERSGHYEHYREQMYFTQVEGQEYGIRPMNCVGHMLIYGTRGRSYRDLPLRYFELGTVHRHEKSGVLHGLLRVRGFTQDDAHILCTPEQLDGEIKGILDFVADVMAIFGFSYTLELSTRPPQSIGSQEDWQRATAALQGALQDKGLPYSVNEGDGAFYGPKIDVKLQDALGRSWQCATIQCDFALPERFDLTYTGPDGGRHRPVMLHRVILGALERFIAILIEHYAGAFPVWLAPVQARILTIADRHRPCGETAAKRLRAARLRVDCNLRNDKIGYKVREAQLEKIPFMLIVGDKEAASGSLAVRLRSGQDLGPRKIEEVVAMVQAEVEQRR